MDILNVDMSNASMSEKRKKLWRELRSAIRYSTWWEAVEICFLLIVVLIYSLLFVMLGALAVAALIALPILAVVFGVLFALDLFGVIGR